VAVVLLVRKAGAYPGSVYDLKAAIQFVRAKAADLGLDPERIGLMGDSAGAHLAALVALAPDQFTGEYRGDPNFAVRADADDLAVLGRRALACGTGRSIRAVLARPF
jgi:acetyl esterase/lipase